MSEKANTDLTDVLASLKSIVADEEEALKEVAVSKGNEMLILASSLRVADSFSGDESQRKEKLEAKGSRPEEKSTDTDFPWEAGAAVQDDYDENLVTEVLLEEIADAINEDTSIDNKGEADDRVEQYREEASFSQRSIDYESLKPMVADIIRKELRGVLGEKITTNIRSLVRREIELVTNKISRDQAD